MVDRDAGRDDGEEKATAVVTQSRRVGVPPTVLLTICYVVVIAIGSFLLQLSVAGNKAINWSEAIFTATSAVTVTGLIVVDTGSAYTVFGQAVIAALVQIGGLGLMAFAVLVLSSLGMSVGLTQKLYLQEDLGQTSISNLVRLVQLILKVFLVAELFGFIALSFIFVPDYGWSQGLWHALFHSISAFNNAGFSLFSDSLINYATNPLVNIIIAGQFIVGGLGFIVIADLYEQRRWRGFSLHTRLMLVGTGSLIVVAMLVIGLLEWENPRTLGQFESVGDKLWVTWFQAVTPRTAGFNTMDTAAMTDGATLFTICLMVIGGGSTSTAGGIKVTTFVVLILGVVAFFRRRSEMHAFSHTIGLDQVLKVMALATTSLVLILISLFTLLVTQEGGFRMLMFEATSAFGTVGLSQGATGGLNDLGRAVICLLMFLGRVGPLILGFFLATYAQPKIRYPAGHVYLG